MNKNKIGQCFLPNLSQNYTYRHHMHFESQLNYTVALVILWLQSHGRHIQTQPVQKCTVNPKTVFAYWIVVKGQQHKGEIS